MERLEEEVAALFPGKRILVLSSDLVATVERLREELAEIEQGKVDVVIGTQLIAKGHHFPKLNLVGFVAAWTLIVINPVVVLTGTLDLWNRWSARSTE